MNLKVILNLLLTYYFPLVAAEMKELYLWRLKCRKKVPMPCDENIKYSILSILKVNR